MAEEIQKITGVAQNALQKNPGTAATEEQTTPGKEEFLKLLAAQLRMQNPLEPINNEEFVAQLAQFSQLEQLINLKALIEQQIQTNLLLSQSITNLSAATLVGKTGIVQSSLIGWYGTPAAIGYTLSSPASKVRITIKDRNGTVIRVIEQENLVAGTHWLEWDGKDQNQNIVQNGRYEVFVEAQFGDQRFTPSVLHKGIIQSVRYNENGAQLVINNIPYKLGEIVEISNS